MQIKAHFLTICRICLSFLTQKIYPEFIWCSTVFGYSLAGYIALANILNICIQYSIRFL